MNNKPNELTIQVCGTCATGKSRIMYLLSEYLKSLNIETNIDIGLDYTWEDRTKESNEAYFKECMNRNLDKVIESFKENLVVNFKEIQTIRNQERIIG